jgi:peptidoglycan/xylan/chitin deacetylase (PgdA/CDA1 family)
MLSNCKKLLLSSYYHATLPLRRFANERRNAAGQAPILVLFYHRVADDDTDCWNHSNRLFADQIHWLRDRFDMISLAEVQRRITVGNDRPAVAITFDDGYAESCDEAIPLLIREGVPCTYFVSWQHICDGRPFPHDAAEGRADPPNTIAQLRDIAAAGIEIGGHTRTHADLGKIVNPQQIFDEVIATNREIEQTLGYPVRFFSFPYGLPENLNARAVRLLKDHGYSGFCSAYGDYNVPGDDPFHIRRVHADDMLRLKNWATIDPRKLRDRYVFDYEDAKPQAARTAI